MQIRFAFGPHAGQVKSVDRTNVVELLVEAGVLEAVESAPVPRESHPANVRAPQWSVGRQNYDPVIVYSTGRTTLYYTGTPDGAVAHFGKAGLELPYDILREYTVVCNSPLPLVGPPR